ncbi:DUF1542 domain-containing protein, partial [Aerococcaceae bacterium zg-ZJ1578]|uniref:DUF1542 domain-containing protein n=1 Tax=Aerococcaceae bacterium zg-252 TaxID=2796928 RepID=UPI001A1BF458|nr:DUF1542 domain-containing protein [Aerococcaceae bacterium zg-1578]
MFYKKKDRFSIRKFKIGVGSVFLGSFLVAGPQVFADTGETVETVPESSLASPELETIEEVPVAEETSTTTSVAAEEVSVTEETTQVEESSQAPADKTALEAEVAKFAHFESEERYLYATTKEQYDQALQAAKTVLTNDAASQEEVDQAVRALQVAEESLNGVKPAEEETTTEEKVVAEAEKVVAEAEKVVAEAEKVESQVEPVVTESAQPTEEASRSAEQPAEKTEVTFPTDKLTLEAFKQLSAAEVKALTEDHFRQLNLSDEDVAGLSFELAKALSSSRTYQRYNRSRGEMPEGTGFRTDGVSGPRTTSTNDQTGVTTIGTHEFTNDSKVKGRDWRDKSTAAAQGRFVNGDLNYVPANFVPMNNTRYAQHLNWGEPYGPPLYADIKPSELTAAQAAAFGWKPIAENGYVTIVRNYAQRAIPNSTVQPDTNYLSLGKFVEYFSNNNATHVEGYEGAYQDITVNPNSEFIFSFDAHYSTRFGVTSPAIAGVHPFKMSVTAVDDNGAEGQTIVAETSLNPGRITRIVNVPEGVRKIRIKLWDDKIMAPWDNHRYSNVQVRNFSVQDAGRLVTDYKPTVKYAVSGGANGKATFDNMFVRNIDGNSSARLDGWEVRSPENSGVEITNTDIPNDFTPGANYYNINGGVGNVETGTRIGLRFLATAPADLTEKKEYELRGTLKYSTTSALNTFGATAVSPDRRVDSYTVDPGLLVVLPKAQGTTDKKTVAKGESLGNAEEFITNKDKLTAEHGTIVNYRWETTPDTATAGEDKTANVIVTYILPDGTQDTVTVPVTFNVTDKDELKTKVAEEPTVTKDDKYTYADPDKQTAYDRALASAKEILAKPDATQNDVDTAKQNLETAQNALDGDTKTAAEKVNLEVNNKVPDVAQGSTLPTDSDALRDLFIANPAALPAGATLSWLAPSPSTDTVADNVAGTIRVNFADQSHKDLPVKFNVKDQTPPAEPTLRPQPDGSVVISTPDDAKSLVVTVADGTPVELEKDNQGNWTPVGGQTLPDGYKSENGKLLVPSTNNQTVTAIVKDEAGNSSTPDKVTANDQIAAAKAEIEKAKEKKNQAIDDNQDMTQDEKNTAKQAVEKAANEAITALNTKAEADKNAALTSDTVDFTAVGTEKQKGLDAIDAVPLLAKDKANQEIDKAAETQKTAINATPNATQADKEAAVRKVEAAVEKAKAAITAATTPEGVTAAKEAGKTAIEAVEAAAAQKDPLEDEKAEAKAKIAEAKQAKEQAIDNNTDLTAEEKQAAKDKVAAEADKANKVIDAATSNQGVTDAQTAGETAVREVPETAVKKAEAKAAIDKKAADRKLELALRTDLSPEEKEAVLADVEKAATAEKEKVDQATDNAGVDAAKTAGETAVKAVDKVGKDQANAAIDDAQKAKDKEIDDNKDLTAEEKEAAKEQTKQKAEEAKQAIDNAANKADVDKAKTDGKTAVTGVAPTADKKTAAKQAVEAKATEAKNAIDQNQNLSQAEKDAKKAEVDAEANKAKAAIDVATNNTEVDKAKTDGENAVNDIQLVGKENALKAIDDAAAEKEKAINDNAELTAEEKAKAKEAVAQAAKDEKQKVNDATTQEAVNAAQEAGVKAVNDVEVTPAKKKEAKAAIDEKLKEKENLINTANGLTEDEKKAKKAEANKLADEAKEAIDAATTDAAVDTAKTKGTGEIEKVNPNAVTKPEATKAIDEAKAAKDQEIDGNKDLTDEEKQAAKEQTKQAADKAKQAIEKATTNDAVTDAKTDGLNALNAVSPTPEMKNTAKGSIDTAKAQQEQAVDANPDLTDEEKAAAKAELAKKAQEAKDAIDAATTNAAVGDVINEKSPFFNNFAPQPVQKEAAKAKVEEVAKAKEAAIDNNTQATDEEKVAAKQKVQ